MRTRDEKIDLYAELAIRVGVNLQKGQTLVIGQDTFPVPLECADFVRRVTKKAYSAGAKHVHVNWDDPELHRIRLEHASDESLDEYPAWKVRFMEDMVEDGAAFLAIYAPNPDLLKGIDLARSARANKAKANALGTLMNAISNFRVNYSIISAPSAGWAKKLFPDLSTEDAVNALWDLILDIVRVNEEDPFEAWENHVAQLGDKTEYLNSAQFKRLYYSAPGTDLAVELPENHAWISLATVKNANNVPFLPNVPSEEIFTAPHRTGVNGTLRSTIPLNYNGVVIENMQFTFEDGRIVDYSAETGLDALKGIVESDDGARYLGELALVPVDSPISKLNRVFLNPLYDENASCHFAIGRAYSACVAGGQSMSAGDLVEHGLNQSMTHVDFMVGSNTLDIDGETKDGKRIALFRQGSWAVPNFV